MKKRWLRLMVVIGITGHVLTGCKGVSPQQNAAGESAQVVENDLAEQEAQENVQGEDQTETEDSTQSSPQDNPQNNPQQEIAGETYVYEDMTITIPSVWEDKYIIKEGEDGFALIQKSSYEKEEGWGYLFGFYKSGEMVDESCGATQLAYTDEYMYYVQEPTDVAFWYEDEAIAAEYTEMYTQKEAIVASLTIDADNVRYDAHEYMLAMSDIKEIPQYYLENMSTNQLWIARNEMFARHGRKFDNAYLSNYFESCSWYNGTVAPKDFDESVLSQVEKKNLEIIKSYENARAGERNYPQSCQFGKEYSYDLDGDGTKESFEINYREDEEISMYHVSMVMDGDMVMELSSEEVYYCYPNTDEYYITDISPYFEGLEIAVMDYGMSDDLVTHFYIYDDELKYIGTVGGFPFKKYMNIDGFAWEGCVRGTIRSDLIHTCLSYVNWFYDYKEKKLKLPESSMNQMVPTGGYELTEDIEVFTSQNVASPKKVLKAQKIFFLETDGAEWIKIKGKDGNEGYLHVTGRMIDGVSKDPQELIQGIFFAG